LVSWRNHQKQKSLFARRIFAVSEYELSNGTLRFFDVKGLLKKKWTLVKEIPVYEITSIESYWNELSVTWNGVTNLFFRKDSFESFSDLRQKILVLLEERRKTLEFDEKASLRKTDLISIIGASIDIVDLSFDILIGLQEKRVDWKRLEVYSSSLAENLNFPLQTLVPFMLDFQKISSAVNKQVPKETSKEVYRILKSAYGYFDSLKPEDDLKETHPNFQDAKAIINAYYTLNDLLLGKVVGEKDNKKEKHQLESVLQILVNNTNFKVGIEELKIGIDKVISENDLESIIEDVRAIFREKITQF
jgi:hypothetical protein